MVFQVVHHHSDDERGGFAQIEIFSGREPTPNQPVQGRLDEDDRRFFVQISPSKVDLMKMTAVSLSKSSAKS